MAGAGNVEIERKWLCNGFPPLQATSEEHQCQGYLAYQPSTVRIRCTVYSDGRPAAHWLTIKGSGGLKRTEVELPLNEGQYRALLELLAGPLVSKRLRRYPLPGGLELECSCVDEGEPTGFYYAEVEFASEQAAAAFIPPPWLGREVTGEAGCSMAEYSLGKAAGQAGAAPGGAQAP